jgi:hypothetical protein
MRFFLVLLVLLAGAGIYLYLNPESATHLKKHLPQTEFGQKTDRIYKWRNAEGEWQLTDTPPPDGIEYERTDYREDLNVLPVPPGIDPQ